MAAWACPFFFGSKRFGNYEASHHWRPLIGGFGGLPYTDICLYIYIYMYVDASICMCIYMCMFRER